MDYGDIIKRAWKITWRYKSLWVLGVFAGISGCQGGGGSSGRDNSAFRTDSDSISGDWAEAERFFSNYERWLPYALAIAAVFFVIWAIWALVSVAAKGGLVTAASFADDERSPGIGQAWSAGFSRFGTLLGLHVVLKLPVFLLSLVVLAVILVPVVLAISAGSEPSPGIIAPICGGLLAVPFLIALGLVLDVLFLIALRYVMLGGQRTMDSVRNAWSFMRARFKDTAVMYLLNGVMNVGAGIVLSVVTVMLAAGAGLTAVGGAFAVDASLSWVFVPIFIVIMLAILGYTAVWGAFTSALWTVYFRRVTGMWVPVAAQYSAPMAPVQPATTTPPPTPAVATYPPPPPASEGYAPYPPIQEEPPHEEPPTAKPHEEPPA